MEDPAAIASRLTQTAKDIADEARTLAQEAIDESDDVENYTAGQFIASFTKSVDLAVKSGLRLTRDVLDHPGPPDPNAAGRGQVADVMETIGRRMIRQAGAVARDTADQMETTPNSPNLWLRSMVKVANISLLGSIELAETALIGPAKYEKDLTLSDAFSAPGTGVRSLELSPDGLARPGTSDPIPAERVTLRSADGSTMLPDGLLAAGETAFRIGVDPRHLISGMYTGDVVVTWTEGAAGHEGKVPVEIAI